MLLHLLRHAHAGDPSRWGGPDAERPLSDKGREQADRLGRSLAEWGFLPGAVLTSPKVRARETAELVAGHLGVAVTVEDRLAEDADLATVEAILRDAGQPDRPVLVGHDPDFSELLEGLCGTALPMRKGTLVRIEVATPLRGGAGKLRWLVPPDLLKPGG